jgi:hypothetical protein
VKDRIRILSEKLEILRPKPKLMALVDLLKDSEVIILDNYPFQLKNGTSQCWYKFAEGGEGIGWSGGGGGGGC